MDELKETHSRRRPRKSREDKVQAGNKWKARNGGTNYETTPTPGRWTVNRGTYFEVKFRSGNLLR